MEIHQQHYTMKAEFQVSVPEWVFVLPVQIASEGGEKKQHNKMCIQAIKLAC